MTEPKFTPGPWVFYNDSNDGKTNRIEIAAFGKTVAHIYHSDPQEDLPNAHLVAAVPELYFWGDLLVQEFEEAQSLLVSMLLDKCPEALIEDQAELNRIAIQNMKAALAKARGEG